MKSTARLFGAQTPRWLRHFLIASVSLMGLAAIMALSPGGNVLALVLGIGAAWAFGWHLAWQMGRLDIDDPDRCMHLFRSNRDAGLIAALFLALAMLV